MQVFHRDRLKICRDREVPIWMRRLRHEFLKLDVPLESSSSEEEDLDPCEIDAVFDVQLPTSGVESERCQSSSSDSSGDETAEQVPVTITRRGRRIKKPSYLKDFAV